LKVESPPVIYMINMDPWEFFDNKNMYILSK